MKSSMLTSKKMVEHTNRRIICMSKRKITRCSAHSPNRINEKQINELFALSKGTKNAIK